MKMLMMVKSEDLQCHLPDMLFELLVVCLRVECESVWVRLRLACELLLL